MTTTPQPTDGAIDDRTQGLINRMQKWAADCQDSDDAETDLTGVFLPETYSGDFHDVMTAAVELLRTRPAQLGGGVDAWQPIESAPKSVADGTRVEGIYLLGFVPDADAVDPSSCMDTIWWEPLLPNNAGKRGKWCAGKSDIEVSPTHWQPLPPPPRALGKGGA